MRGAYEGARLKKVKRSKPCFYFSFGDLPPYSIPSQITWPGEKSITRNLTTEEFIASNAHFALDKTATLRISTV